QGAASAPCLTCWKNNIVTYSVPGLRISGDQKQITSSLPVHLADVLAVGDGVHGFSDPSGMYVKNTPPMPSNNISSQGTMLQSSGAQLIGRSAASPAATGTPSFDNTTTSPLPYANSPRSGTNMMNTPSPQQQPQQQQQQQQQQQLQQQQQQQPQQQRQKLTMLQHQLLPQQQFRQSSMQGMGQNQLPLHDLQVQAQQKFQSVHGQHPMQFSQSLGQYQSRQLPSGHVQHGIGQSQLNQGSQLLNRHLGQFSGPANSTLFNAAQGTPNTQMIPNVSATMSSQSLMPRTQYGLPGSNSQRQILTDQMFNMGTSNPSGMMQMQQQQQQQQQQHTAQGAFGNMPANSQNLQANMVALQNNPQNHPNFAQRQQNQQ
ncbi:hypothetical protein SLE2022_338060, partial [Rubroshorea leprosula]